MISLVYLRGGPVRVMVAVGCRVSCSLRFKGWLGGLEEDCSTVVVVVVFEGRDGGLMGFGLGEVLNWM